jgi:hypothetical protein
LLGVSVSDATVLHLTLPDHVHELDAAQQDPGATKILEAEHRPRASLDRPMVLLDNIVQILVLANLDWCFPLRVQSIQRGRFAPLLSIVTVSGSPFCSIDFSN